LHQPGLTDTEEDIHAIKKYNSIHTS